LVDGGADGRQVGGSRYGREFFEVFLEARLVAVTVGGHAVRKSMHGFGGGF